MPFHVFAIRVYDSYCVFANTQYDSRKSWRGRLAEPADRARNIFQNQIS